MVKSALLTRSLRPLSASASSVAGITKTSFGQLVDGTHAYVYRLSNGTGAWVDITSVGGAIVGIHVPDHCGVIADVTLGFDHAQQYVKEGPFFGGIIGRFANRIASGHFCLGDSCYQLDTNEGKNSLHGGSGGFDKRLWSGQVRSDARGDVLQLVLLSADGDQGYPGQLVVTAEYRFDRHNRLSIHYSAESDQDTIVNLTQHPYFNLNGHDKGDILGHQLMLNADHYLPIDEAFIPTGAIQPVDHATDFRRAKPIGESLFAEHEQLKIARGYDHTWVVSKSSGDALPLAATLYAPESRRRVSVYTDQPGLQFYSGNHLTDTLIGKGGVQYRPFAGAALEAQHFPDSPNQPHFPSTALKKGEVYTSRTELVFGVN